MCLLRACQPRSAGDAAKLGQFIGQFSWVIGNPIGLKGLISVDKDIVYIVSLLVCTEGGRCGEAWQIEVIWTSGA